MGDKWFVSQQSGGRKGSRDLDGPLVGCRRVAGRGAGGRRAGVRGAGVGPRYPCSVSTHETARFWADVRNDLSHLPTTPPEAWAFGATPEHADELLDLVLAGTKTATASALQDYEAEDEQPPLVGDLSIILDGSGSPRAVLEVIAIDIVPFDQVDEEHARAEGEDDRTLDSWRRIHEQFWRDHAAAGFSEDMPVLCERFRVVHPAEG